jgi:glycosyltransferase involved in cell wall biosynthesis
MLKSSKMATGIAMVAFSYYLGDPRIRREAEALVKSGMSVDVICLRGYSEPKMEIIHGVRVYRVPLERKRGGKLTYLWRYFYFSLLSFFLLSYLHFRNRYKVIHVHNMPDILVFTSLLPRLSGSKIILDLHDPMPELSMAKYSINGTHPIFRFLCLAEKYSIRFSDLVLTPNIAFRRLFVSRGCPKSKIHVIMNSPQESIFQKTNPKMSLNRPMTNNKFVLMYHGTILERNGLDIALKAVVLLRQRIPNLVFEVYGDGEFLDQSRKLMVELGLKDIVNYHGDVPLENIPLAIQSADVGVIPNKPSFHWEHAMPTRIFEYLCLGKPVVAPRTRGIIDYFDDESMYFHESGNSESLADVILELHSDPEGCRKKLEYGMSVYHAHRWEFQRQRFLKLVTSLLHPDTL